MDSSKLAQGLYAIPILNFGLTKANHAYSALRGYNALTAKSLQWAESATGFVFSAVGQNRLTKTGLSLVGPKLEALDQLAAQRLADLETKVPAINTQPEEVLPAVKEKAVALGDRLIKSSDWILVTKPAQKSFDILDFLLTHVASTLDKVLPPKDGKSELPPHPEEGKGGERALWVLAAALEIMKTTKDRVVDHLRGRMGGPAAAEVKAQAEVDEEEEVEDKENLGTD